MGVATLIQTTIGNRLPIIQGPSATLTGTLAPVAATLGPGAMWGAAFAGGLAEMAFGASRALNFLRRRVERAHLADVVSGETRGRRVRRSLGRQHLFDRRPRDFLPQIVTTLSRQTRIARPDTLIRA
jgi:hypothetical protein